MVKINDLPVDILYEVTKYLTLRDVCVIRKTSSVLNYKINCIQNSIMNNELRRSGKSYQTTNIMYLQNLFYSFINYYLVTFLYKFRKNNIAYNNAQYLRNYIMYYSYTSYRGNFIDGITNNFNVNLLFDKIFYYYIYTDYAHISTYPNKLELCALYNFLQIEIFQNKHDFDYWLDFLESLNKTRYSDIIFRYYSSTLDIYHTHNVCLTFAQMYTMSSVVTSIPIIKKIIGYRVLDLSLTKLNLCCMNCNEANIFDICELKFSYYKDDLISYNYLQFKDFLKKENLYYYTVLTNRETFLVNTMIYVKNPITNRRMRLNGNVYKQFIRSMESDKHSNKYYVGVLRYIYKQQKLLKNRYFT